MFRNVGRPRCNVDIEDIEFLRTLKFSYTKIAEILKVSRSTLYRKMEEEGVSFNQYSQVSDQVLDDIVTRIKRSHPNDGERLLIGHLRSQNIFLPRTHVRASIHRTDPEGTAARRSVTVRRRVYHMLMGPTMSGTWMVTINLLNIALLFMVLSMGILA